MSIQNNPYKSLNTTPIFPQKIVEEVLSSSITLSSLDSDPTKVDELFKKSIEPVNRLDKYEQRKLANEAKKLAKEQRHNKSIKNKQTHKIVLPETKNIKKTEILELRYTQDSINYKTMDGTQIEALINNMKTQGWKAGSSVTVVLMPDGKLTCMDNRRLFAAQTLVSSSADPIILSEGKNKGKEFEMKVDIYNFEDNASKAKLRGCISEYKKGRKLTEINKLPEGFSENTYGHLALLRINTRNGDLQSSHFGYESSPEVRIDS